MLIEYKNTLSLSIKASSRCSFVYIKSSVEFKNLFTLPPDFPEPVVSLVLLEKGVNRHSTFEVLFAVYFSFPSISV